MNRVLIISTEKSMKKLFAIILLCLLLVGCGARTAQPEVTPTPAPTPAPTPTPTPTPVPVPTLPPIVEESDEYDYNTLMSDAARLMGRYGEDIYLYKACQSFAGRSIPCIEIGDQSTPVLLLCSSGSENALMTQLEDMLTEGISPDTALCILPSTLPDGGEWEYELDEFMDGRSFAKILWFDGNTHLRDMIS